MRRGAIRFESFKREIQRHAVLKLELEVINWAFLGKCSLMYAGFA